MHVSVDKLIQPYASYSRTGKMTEAMSSSSIRVKASTKPSGVDYSKALAANELGHQEPSDEAYLCSSPRLHPSVALKTAYITRQEMERAFRVSVKSVFEAPADKDAANTSTALNKSTASNALMTPADWKAMKAALREQNKKKIMPPSAAFLAVSRGKASGNSSTSNNPPVGHYRPKFHIVEESAPGVKICKRLSSPTSARGKHRVASPQPHAATSQGAVDGLLSLRESNASPSSPNGDPPTFSPGGQQRTGASSPAGGGSNLAASLNGKTQNSASQATAPAAGQRALTPSWPFASASPGHVLQVNRSWSVEPDPTRKVNAALVERHSGSSKVHINLALVPGRKGIGDSVKLKDVFYNANPFSSEHTPSYRFDVAPGRDRTQGLPRTSANVPRVAPEQVAAPDLDMSKYKRQALLVNFSRSLQVQPTRKLSTEKVVNSDSRGGNDEEVPLSPQRVSSPDFRNYLKRPNPKIAVSGDLIYDVSYQEVDRHKPAAFIKEPVINHHAKPVASEQHHVSYNPDDSTLHPALVRNIAFDAYVTRDKRNRSGREAAALLNEAQHKFYNTDVPPRRSNGNTGMGQQVSRDQRAEVLSPKLATVDSVYDTNADSLLPGLRRGMVEMDKMVDREKRSHSSMR